MQQENKMGVMPVNRLILTMSLPMILSMLVQALYNIVDSMFVSRLSENALTAVSLAFPAQNLMIAVATGTGVGVNAALSRSLGERNFDRANKIADHAVFLAIASYAVFAVLGLFFHRLLFSSLITIHWGDCWTVPWAELGTIVLIMLLSVALVVVLHLWKRQMLLSIAGGTVCYMLLVQLVF